MKKILTSCTLILLLTVFSCISVFATEYWGSSSSYSAGSYSVRHASYMSIESRYAQARTKISNTSGNLPPGTLGVNPRAYDASTGVLLVSGGWTYSDDSFASMDVPVDVSGYSGYLYSRGMTALWNGSSYTTKSTTSSPNAKFKPSRTALQVNPSGQTFGSALNAECIQEEPELILAKGVDDIVGYVKNTDLNRSMAKSPQEAAKAVQTRGAYFIPLYKSDGKTVIGKFKITSTTKDIERKKE